MAASAGMYIFLFLLLAIGATALALAIIAYDSSNNNNNSNSGNTFDTINLTNTSNQIALGATGTITTINGPAPASDITLTLPITTDTLVGRATTDTLTNKTLTAPFYTKSMDTIMGSTGLAAASSGTTYVVTDNGGTITLPAPPALGYYYKFVASETITSDVTVTAGSAIINGYIINASTVLPVTNQTNIKFIGGNAQDGDTFTLESNNSQWFVLGFGQVLGAIDVS